VRAFRASEHSKPTPQARRWQRSAGAIGLLAALLGPVGGAAFGCAGGASPSIDPSSLPRFGPADAVLFDGRLVLEPALEHADRARAAAKLHERARIADAVLRVRVQTVTRASVNLGVLYTVTVEPLAPALAGDFTPGPISLSVSQDDPAFSSLRLLGARLVAKTLVLFLKSYSGGPGQVTLRWHAEPDSADLQARVLAAAATP